MNKLAIPFILYSLSLFGYDEHKHKPTNKFRVTIYVESPTLNEVDVARQLMKMLPFINTQTLKVYHDFLEVETLDGWPALEIEEYVAKKRPQKG